MEIPPLAVIGGVLAAAVLIWPSFAMRQAQREIDALLGSETALLRQRAWLAAREGPPDGRTRGPCVVCLTPTRLIVRLTVPRIVVELPLGTIHAVSLTDQVLGQRRTTRPMLHVTATAADGSRRSATVLLTDARRWADEIAACRLTNA